MNETDSDYVDTVTQLLYKKLSLVPSVLSTQKHLVTLTCPAHKKH